MELLSPAGNLTALRAAVDNGADTVYIGFRDETNARQFPGLNFTPQQAAKGVSYAHEHGVKVAVAINSYVQANGWDKWRSSVDEAGRVGADAVILADLGLIDYAAQEWPQLARHLSVQASATTPESLNFYQRRYGVKRAVLPRVLSIQQVEALAKETNVELEVFGFGSLCVMAEGRCLLSSYATGESPNTVGACSPAWAVDWQETDLGREVRLGGILIDRFSPDEPAGYPTICKGRYNVSGSVEHAFESPTSLATAELLPQLKEAGIQAIKIEGRQRSPAYVGKVTRIWRQLLEEIDSCAAGTEPDSALVAELLELCEGSTTTLGPYERKWQ
ncbi:ubiquinone anaerobic biosynthesis protein UbiU [Halorhodospira halochloris]|uniref:ubiquinone anaerobic biosynthesis protein UbiU n=1 Tax=Halorhodospira halochloris TaxID=1052 RepID=UPI001EE944B6|nr:peptidase U32 family protein [Halorhodospira halochloris]MCG5547312.1 U32 family peptidase [Halorhodospira halochloris]